MEASKPSMRTRKVVNYVALNGDGSDDSEDDIVNRVNTKVAVPTATVTKPSKLSKLKLGTRKESRLPKCDSTKTAKLRPILDNVAPTKLPVTPPFLTNNMEDIAEPELITHSIFSQETVITSTCECLSPHEFTDSSESDTHSSTVEITSAKEDAKLNTKLDPAPLKTSEDRITKRRIINENFNRQKKIKIDIEQIKSKNTLTIDQQSVPKPVVDVSVPLAQISRLPNCLLWSGNLSPEHPVPPHQHFAVPLNAHDEVSIFEEGPMQSSTQATNQLRKEDYSSETEYIPTLNVIKISEKSGSIVNSPTPALSTPKSTKRATKEEGTRKVQVKKNTLAIPKLKDNLPNSMESRGKSKSKSTPAVIDEQIAKASSSVINDGDTKGLGTPRNVASLPCQVSILMPPSPQSKKPGVKWKPPGKAGGISTPLGGNSPAIGIRLGLSRNRRASKPLHPDVKVKI